MKILILGNMGYVGPVVVRHLRSVFPQAELVGYDTGYFGSSLTAAEVLPERWLDRQVFGDVREFDPDLLAGCDAVVQLAAISNDPMGHRFEAVTAQINQQSSLAIAAQAARAGVDRFVFASSCSVYGVAAGGPRSERDAVAPVTAYARSKIGTEQGLAALATDMAITCLRFSTACGMSDRLRLDLVLNDFVAAALASGEISVLSDGSPWRPLIDVADMARAIAWAVQRPSSLGGRFLAVNVGSDERNYQVRELAAAVAAQLPGTRVSINHQAPADSRSYRVDFGLYRALAPGHQPQVDLADSIAALIAGLRRMGFADRGFREGGLIRLNVLQRLMAAGMLDPALRWLPPRPDQIAAASPVARWRALA